MAVRDSSGNAVPVQEVFKLVQLGYIGTSQPVEALVQHHVDVISRLEALDDRSQSFRAAAATFEGNLANLNPVIGADASKLRRSYPSTVERLVLEVVRSADRARTLQDWAQHVPSWLSDVADIQGWIGELAADSGANAAALRWFDKAVENGVQPRAYWKVRRMWLAGSKDEAAALDYLADVLDDDLTQAVLRTNPPAARRAHLDAWKPETEAQTSIRNALSLDLLLERGLYDEVIESGLHELDKRKSTVEATRAVEALLRRSATNDRMLRSADVAEAITLGLRIRDMRRSWGGATGTVVAHVMRAYSLLMDPEKAWRLSQLPPEGEATPSEANDPGIRSLALALMAEAGRVSEAKALLDDSVDPGIRLQVEAREAEMLLEPERAQALWSEAIRATDDWSEKASLCLRLATKGYVDPFVAELRADNPDVADEIESVAALFAEQPGAIGRAKSLAATNPRISRAVQMFLTSKGRWSELGTVADQVAQLHNNPDDWLRAAHAQLQLGNAEDAIDRASKALQAAGELWGNRFDAFALQLEAAFRLKDWKTASAAAIAMIGARPDADEPRWALVLVRLNEGEIEEAYRVWAEKSPRPQPNSENETLAWLEMFRIHGSEMASYAEFRQVADRFTKSHKVRNAAAGALMTAPITEQDVRIDLDQVFQDLERDFPGQTGVIRIKVDTEDPQALIAQLDELAGGRRDAAATTQLDEGIRSGTVPLGAAAHVTNRNLAETLIVNREAPRFAGSATGDFDAVDLSVGQPVVLDVTALLTLSMLSDEHADALAESFALKSSSHQLIDANTSKEAIYRNQGGVFIPSSDHAEARFIAADPVELDERRRLVDRLIECFRATQRLGGPVALPEPIAALEDVAGTWTAAANIAIENRFSLWCDDAATRALAGAAGIPTFGTPQVVEYLRSVGQLPTTELDAIDAMLIHQWVVGIKFRLDCWELALSLDGFRPRGIAAALEFGQRTDIEAKVRIILRGMSNRVESPVDLSRWSAVGATLVSEAAGNDEAGVQDNRVAFMRQLLAASWTSPTTLPWVVQGVRQVSGNSWAAVFTSSLRTVVSAVAQARGHDVAVPYFLGLIQGLDEPDRLLGVGVLLEP